jgi:hypothetical protein
MLLALCGLLAASPAFAQQATCAPVSASAKILASADFGDIHPGWSDGSTIGLSWSLLMTDDAQGSDGNYYIIGDLVDPRGNVVDEGVYVDVMEWECDVE